MIVKSDFGSFNCFEFSEDYKLIALGGQDDAITIINIELNTAFKLNCHRSFITSCVWFPRTMLSVGVRDRIYQLVVGSMDSTISFWEIDILKTSKLKLSNSQIIKDF